MRSTNKDDVAQGIVIAIESADTRLNQVHCELLEKELNQAGYEVTAFYFPQTTQPSGYFAENYKANKYGNPEEVGPYAASLFDALDRYDAAQSVRDAKAQGKVVLLSGFTGNTMAHQGSLFKHVEERRGYFIWLDNLEFMLFKILRPDTNFVLRTDADSAIGFDELCNLFPRDFTQIDCMRNGRPMDTENIQNILREKVHAMLPRPSRKKALPKDSSTTSAPNSSNPYIRKTENGLVITEQGREFLEAAVTNTESTVYGFTDKLSPVTIAAAMARLSRRGDDMRITILDEFTNSIDKDAQLLQRVIPAYGDDSVQQLVSQHIVIENASNLLTKKLEWGRLGSYMEQSTRCIYFDQKNKDGKYKYFTPSNLDKATKATYEESMNSIFELYSEMVHRLTDYVRKQSKVPKEEQDAAWLSATRAQACDAVRPVLPVATQSTVGIFASSQALESLVIHLQSDELLEAQETGKKILEETRKNIPVFLERTDKPERGGATIAYRANTRKNVQSLANELLQENYANASAPVTLTDVWPRNELEVVADILYEHSSLPLKDIRDSVDTWTYDKKASVLAAYMGERLNRRHKPGRALEKIHYSFDLMCDYGIFRDLQRHRMVDDLEWQALTPRYGYEVPALVEEAGLADLFERCFDISLGLHSELQAAGHELEAQYTTLLGHRMRWKVTYNAREAFHLHELRTSPQGHPGYRKLVQQMHDAVANVHPLVAEAMKFVSQGEDEALTRLAAERYTQFKLAQFGK